MLMCKNLERSRFLFFACFENEDSSIGRYKMISRGSSEVCIKRIFFKKVEQAKKVAAAIFATATPKKTDG